MARPNRNNQNEAAVIVTQKTTYQTAIYARLSVEDNGCGSDSIENQIYMIEKYIKENAALSLFSTHFDNGMTGTNFDRPGFIAMLDEVKKGSVNCIVVKDLSRFGRNYTETGNYLENIFPYLGVRFISVNDNYDSIDATANEALALSLKNVYHHIYAKDISRKICTLFDVKKKNGLFLGKFAPYGYKKSPTNHYQLEIDVETAPVIRKIFELRMSGMGVVAIAKRLNDSHVKSQYRRLYENGLLKGTNGEATAIWSGSSVLGILENPNYYGCIVERKSDGAYYKGGQTRILPKSEWQYIENTHDGIIDKDTFETVQELIAKSKQSVSKERVKKSHRERTENILCGLVVCGSCKRKMARDGGYYDEAGNLIRHRYGCPQKYQKSGGCPSASIVESELINTVFSMLKAQILLLAESKEILMDYRKSPKYQRDKCGFQAEIAKVMGDMEQVKIKTLSLYKDYKQGLLSNQGYAFAQKKYEGERSALEKKLCELEKSQSKVKKIAAPDTDWISDVLSCGGETVLTREMCLKLIESIEVFGTHIQVTYTFHSEYEDFVLFLNQYAKVGECR